jgi:prophage regulatory protein
MNLTVSERILRLPEVKEITGLSTSTIYAWMIEGKFPKSINLGNRSVGWLESAIASWISSRSQS